MHLSDDLNQRRLQVLCDALAGGFLLLCDDGGVELVRLSFGGQVIGAYAAGVLQIEPPTPAMAMQSGTATQAVFIGNLGDELARVEIEPQVVYAGGMVAVEAFELV